MASSARKRWRWFDPFGRAESYGRLRWSAASLEELRTASREVDADVRLWGVACLFLGVGLCLARLLIGDDYGFDRFGESPRSGPHDRIVVVCLAILVVIYVARRGFMRAAYYGRVDEWRRTAEQLPEPEREAQLEAYYRESL